MRSSANSRPGSWSMAHDADFDDDGSHQHIKKGVGQDNLHAVMSLTTVSGCPSNPKSVALSDILDLFTHNFADSTYADVTRLFQCFQLSYRFDLLTT